MSRETVGRASASAFGVRPPHISCRRSALALPRLRHQLPLTRLAPKLAVADPTDPYKLTDDARSLGLVVCRGTSVMLIAPVDGTEEIANPFAEEEEVI